MSEEGTGNQDVTVRLAKIIEELPPSMRPALEEANGEIVRLRTKLENIVEAHNRHVDLSKSVEKDRDQLTTDNANLRNLLHETELDVARLRGYQDRVTEFDPVSNRAEYEDRLPRARDHGFAAERTYVDQGSRRAQWYLRRA